jgi:hypothetical protein
LSPLRRHTHLNPSGLRVKADAGFFLSRLV